MSQVRQAKSLERAGSARQAAKNTESGREDRTRGDLWLYLYREEASAWKGMRSPPERIRESGWKGHTVGSGRICAEGMAGRRQSS